MIRYAFVCLIKREINYQTTFDILKRLILAAIESDDLFVRE